MAVLRFVVLPTSLLAFVGCGLLLGTDDYSASAHGGRGGVAGGPATAAGGASVSGDAGIYGERAAANTFNPQSGVACERCVLSNCADEVNAILIDEVALQISTCAANLPRPVNPAALWDCLLSVPPEGPLEFNFGQFTPNGERGTCAGASCQDECLLGRQFACSGRYEWPDVRADVFPVDVQVFLGGLTEPVEGAEVQLCERGESELQDATCNRIGNPALTKERGLARLTMSAGLSPTVLGTSARDAYVLVSETPSTWATRLYLNRPWYQPTGTLPILVYAKPADAGAGAVNFLGGQVLDCVGTTGAFGVEVELDRSDGVGSDFVRYGLDHSGTDATDGLGVFWVTGVEESGRPTMASLSVKDPESGTVLVQRFEFPLHPRTYHQFSLWPDARNFR